ncbi:enoyl-CoA hydratase/isomerase family protein [Candidatus Poribacteria bacterium]|nr:enoyl-CoA hydratase/isomerase family protein [Candidatus Poribacteria bacterium]MYI95226.1 enoyl-CoA hydratase/isomerase family protein [Candidatus Poribacteria bacterium]
MSISKTAEKKIIISNEAASLIDIDDGILFFELHTKLNIIEDDTLGILDTALNMLEMNYSGMVVGTEADNFSVGLNLLLLLERAKSKDWDAISKTLRNLQKVCQRLRFSTKPVVVATKGMALGGGCELTFAADAVQAFTESKLGLVELRVGLIPGGGGTTEMSFRCLEGQDTSASIQELFTHVHRTIEIICQARVSRNAADAVELGYLRKTDFITSQKDTHFHESKELAISLSNSDYHSPQQRQIFVLGEDGIKHHKQKIQQLLLDNTVNDYELSLAEKLAYVFCGGMLKRPQFVNEQELLDLEHDVFLSLCSEPTTHAMIESTLKKGKK